MFAAVDVGVSSFHYLIFIVDSAGSHQHFFSAAVFRVVGMQTRTVRWQMAFLTTHTPCQSRIMKQETKDPIILKHLFQECNKLTYDGGKKWIINDGEISATTSTIGLKTWYYFSLSPLMADQKYLYSRVYVELLKVQILIRRKGTIWLLSPCIIFFSHILLFLCVIMFITISCMWLLTKNNIKGIVTTHLPHQLKKHAYMCMYDQLQTSININLHSQTIPSSLNFLLALWFVSNTHHHDLTNISLS